MSSLIIFTVGAVIFAITVYGAVMSAGVVLTRRFYEQNDAYADLPGSEKAGIGRPTVQPD
jgi:hypothetical protein